jgi:uncharacterized YigZ family protein
MDTGNSYTPGSSQEIEYVDRRSKFLSRCWSVESRDAVKAVISDLRTLHPEANHVVYAFVLGDANSEELGMSDDGEPKGTSGRPTLEVLKGSGLRNALLTTVRYFGGTKLGTGGLVKAYTEAAQAVLARTERLLVRNTCEVECILGYAEYEAFKRYLGKIFCEILDESFGEDVSMHFRIEAGDLSGVRSRFTDLTRGRGRFIRDEDSERP